MTGYSAAIQARLRGEIRHDWRWLAVAGVAAFQSVFVLWLVFKPGGDSALTNFDDISVAAGSFVAGVACLAVLRRHWGSQSGLAWGLIALGMFLFAFGDGSWAFQEIRLNEDVPFPSISDVGYLGAYVPIFLGLLLMPQAPASGGRRLKLTLDVLVGLVAVAVVSFDFIIQPMLEESQGSTLADAVGVAYPFCDLAIVFAVLVLVVRATPGRATGSLLLLGAAFAVTAFADSLYTYLTSVDGYATGSYIDIGWLAGYNLVTLAAIAKLDPRPQRVPLQRSDESPASLWQTAGIYALVIPLGALMIADSGSLIAIGVLGVVGLMLARQLVTLQENLTLNRKLAELTAQLETKVKIQTLELLTERGRHGDESRSGTHGPSAPG
jgi:hypothetical protein